MNVIGIVAEYNPFHTGHAYQIAQSRRQLGENTPVVVVMSGNWVQQANCAIADKWIRTNLALRGGVDLVLELPTLWATASAERFARGAVYLLNACGVVTHLSFGSELGALDSLQRVADCLDTLEFSVKLRDTLNQGISFAAARQQAAAALVGEHAQVLDHANNNLGIEYLRSLSAFDSSITPMTVLRQGAGHNTLTGHEKPTYVSATQIRSWLSNSMQEEAQTYLPPDTLAHFPKQFPNLSLMERGILARFRCMTADDWSSLPDSGAGEGLPQRLAQAGQQACSLEEFYSLASTKRYTNARLRRLVLWSYLGLSAEDFSPTPGYLRVLGSTARGRELLKQMKHRSALPILTKPAHARSLPACAAKDFAVECRCTDLYDLCFPNPPKSGREWTTNPILFGLEHGD